MQKKIIESSSIRTLTVGTGIAPVQLALAGYTADRELHPAPKIINITTILPIQSIQKRFDSFRYFDISQYL